MLCKEKLHASIHKMDLGNIVPENALRAILVLSRMKCKSLLQLMKMHSWYAANYKFQKILDNIYHEPLLIS
jgi:hypothetical protein